MGSLSRPYVYPECAYLLLVRRQAWDWQLTNNYLYRNDGGCACNVSHLHVSTVAPGPLVYGGAHLPLVMWQGLWLEFIFTVVVLLPW